jgi:O-antigen/teichoic acid export membrane protein
LLLAIIILILVETIGVWYINNKMVIPQERLQSAMWVFQFSTASLVLLILQIPYSAAIISHEKMSYFAVVSIIEVVLKLLIVIILPFIPYDKLIFYGILTVLISLFNFVLYYLYTKKHFPEIELTKNYDTQKFREMVSFAGWNTFGSFAYMIQGQGLNILANSFFGPIVNAARGIAFQIQGAINGFSENIATAFRPQLVESYAAEDYTKTQKIMFSMSKFCYLMLTILSIPIIIELQYILNLWLDGTIPEYTEVFTILVLVNMLLGSLNMPISQTVQATGKIRKYQVIRSILVTATLPIAWLFLSLGYSPPTIFWITIAVSFLNQPLSMYLLHKNFDYSYSEYMKKVIFPCFLFTLISPILPWILHSVIEPSFFRLVIVVISSILISAMVAYFIVLSLSERQIVNTLIRKIIKH